MANTIADCLSRIKTVEAGLSITSPETLAIKRVYETTPKQNAVLEAPSFIHGWDLISVRHVAGTRQRHYLVHSQLWTGTADKDRAAQIAAAFEQKWLDAFSNDLTLAGACTGPIVIRGDSPTLARLEYAGMETTGLSLLMEIPIYDTPTVGP